jgi:hypothetical protein
LAYHFGISPKPRAPPCPQPDLTSYAPLARSLGLAPERLAKLAGLDLASANDLDARISADAFAELLERSASAARVDDFGLRLAETRDLGILGPIGITSSRTSTRSCSPPRTSTRRSRCRTPCSRATRAATSSR